MGSQSAGVTNRPSRTEMKQVAILLALYTLCFTGLAIRKFAAMNSNMGDAYGLIQAFWHTGHGQILYLPFNGMSYLGNHAGLLVLWVVPFYWLMPSAYTLYFAQSLSIGASGIPFYLLSRKVLGDRLAAGLMTAAYLFYPVVVTNHVDQLHVEVFALPFLLAAAYYFFEERLVPFLVFALLGMMAQENLPLTVGAFGVYAAVRRRPAKWIVAPILLAAVYGIIALKVLIPYFAGGTPFYAAGYHLVLGRTPDEFLKVLFTQPWRLAADMVDWGRTVYLVEMLQPLLWIVPLLAPEFLLAVPAFGMNLVLDDSYRVIAWHYGPTAGAFLCVAAVFGVRRLAQILESRRWLAQARVTLALCICALSVASWPLWLNLSDFVSSPYLPTLQKAVALASKGQSVVAPSTLIAHLAERESPVLWTQFDEHTRQATTWPVDRMYTMDYVIFDANERRFPKEFATRDLIMSFYTNTNYRLVMNENNVFVFENKRMQGALPGSPQFGGAPGVEP